jgi:hypothetical protein
VSPTRLSRHLSGDGELFSYRLPDHTLLRKDFSEPISTIAGRPLGWLEITSVEAPQLAHTISNQAEAAYHQTNLA